MVITVYGVDNFDTVFLVDWVDRVNRVIRQNWQR